MKYLKNDLFGVPTRQNPLPVTDADVACRSNISGKKIVCRPEKNKPYITVIVIRSELRSESKIILNLFRVS